MKKVMALGILASLFLIPVAGAQAAGQSDDKDIVSEFCADHNDFGLSHGGCVAYFETRNLVPHNASVCRNESFQAFLGVGNHGQCVKKLAEMAR